MSILFRYLLRQFLGPLLTCLISFNAIFVLFDLFGHLSKFLDANLPFLTILQYYGGIVCMYSHWFLPASCLLATLYSMWQLSHHSELTAMRASGIGFVRLTMPFLLVATVAGCVTFANEEWLVPKLSAWSESLKNSGFKDAGNSVHLDYRYTNKAENRDWTFSEIDLTSEETAASPSATNILVEEYEFLPNGERRNVWGLRGDGIEWLDGEWWMKNPRRVRYNQVGQEIKSRDTDTPLPSPLRLKMEGKTFDETPLDFVLKARNQDFLSLREMHRLLRHRSADSSEKWYDYWYRWASPWACVVITFFAIPTGITTGRQSVFKGVLVAIGAFFAFYLLTIILKYYGQHGTISPFLAAWLPNLVFLAAGLVLHRRLS